MGYRDVTFLKWAPSGSLLAAGTAKGAVIIYNQHTDTRTRAEARHKKRIVCGDWNVNECLAFASEDRQITIADPLGRTLDQVKVKCKAHGISFGGGIVGAGGVAATNSHGGFGSNIVSVNVSVFFFFINQ